MNARIIGFDFQNYKQILTYVPVQESPYGFIPVSHSQTLFMHFWPPYGQSELRVQPENNGSFSKHVKVGLKIPNEKD